MKIFFKAFLFIVAAAALFSCSSTQINSEHTEEEIVIDGKHGEWKNDFTYMEDNNFSVGVKNNDEFLYMCFETSNMSYIRQILRFGFTAEFYPEDGSDGNLLLRYPVVSPRMIRRKPQGMPGQGFFSPEKELEKIKDRTEMIEIQQGEESRSVINLSENNEIAAAAGAEKFLLIIEMKIPLDGSESGIGIGAEKGKKVTVKIKTPDIKEILAERRAQGFPGRGMRGGRMPGGGMAARQMPEIPENLDFEFQTVIASRSKEK